ncbi:hypothetical protein WJ0W_004618 [Paenibacillus melissococcoides]|uniref:Phage protein n=3 Tax=Paenibacillus TaxID=44249 RepID=A0ABN8U8C4_9BACL|nr:hypothetical protein [Paenibacillus melissococcoides]MEB9897688.1 hypothetical protein [Bacillus cereus]CAH8247384.1 hypothetical protein WJ0W_004618 [Paenibacillus melissococcoides]CAH8705304.1 hypothetical protein WDD9_000930 [Paenibacillus melissococcoides]CAH8708525.1 hypothetical protein HTL2_002015 [Paenibacillus melissococcoides]
MKQAKKRLRKKYFKRVANGLQTGAPIPNFYIDKVLGEFAFFYHRKYITEFQPWWYEQMETRNDLDFRTEIKRFFDGARDDFGSVTGIDMVAFADAAMARQERKRRVYGPKKQKRRKVTKQPIRKLRRPEQFYIAINGGRRQVVIGERVFQHRGLHFFIRHVPGAYANYVVSDVAAGIAVARHERYKKAVDIAKRRIETMFDAYIKQIKMQKRGE